MKTKHKSKKAALGILVTLLLLLSACSQVQEGVTRNDDGSLRYSSEPSSSGAAELSTAQNGQTLTTIFNENNSFAGNTFDLEVLNPAGVTITGFDINVSGSPGVSYVYWKEGTSVAFENNASAWTSLGSTLVTPQGINNATHVAVNDLFLGPGTYGFYIWNDYPTMNTHYTNGADTYENSDLRLTTQTGVGDPIFNSAIFSPRIWNGRIYYEIGVGGPQIITDEHLGTAFLNRVVDLQLEATGGVAPYSWSSPDLHLAIRGLSLSVDGRIIGRPLQRYPSPRSFTVYVTDANGVVAEQQFTVSVK